MLHDAVEEVLPFNKFLVVNIVVNRAVYKTVRTTCACGRWEWEWEWEWEYDAVLALSPVPSSKYSGTYGSNVLLAGAVTN